MSNDDIVRLRLKIAETLGRVTLLKSQEMLYGMRKNRTIERRKNGTYRLAKEFRTLKSLLMAEERRLLQSARNPRTVRASQRRRALTAKARPPTP